MTDVLMERFAALASPDDDSDWLDVQRRARGRRRYVVAAVAAAAAAVAAAAVAATGGWLFSAHARQVTAVTDVQLHGRTWHVSVTSGGRLRICLRASSGSASASSCRGKPLAPPVGARHVNVAGGQIWAGATVGFTRGISITDSAGKVHTATAVKAPRGAKTPFRYWAIALDGTTARSIAATDGRGHTITKALR